MVEMNAVWRSWLCNTMQQRLAAAGQVSSIIGCKDRWIYPSPLSCLAFSGMLGLFSFAFSEILRLRLYCSVSFSVLLTIHLNVHIKPIAALSMMQT